MIGRVATVRRMVASAQRLLRRTDVQAMGVAGLAALAWLLLGPRTPDLAAQSYRVGLFERSGFTIWDNGWYAGHYLPDYSLLFPGFGAVVGMRVAGVLSAVAAAGCFAGLAERQFGRRARPGILWFGLAAVSDLAIGRLTYSLATALGLGALLALQRHRLALCAGLAGLCAAAAPLAGLFLVFAATVLWSATRAWRRPTTAVIVPALVVMAGLAVAFGEGGRQPFGGRILGVALVMTAIFWATMPARQAVLRAGGWAFGAMTVAAFVLSTPLGDNVTRLGAVFMGPLLACAVAAERPRRVGWAALVAMVGLGAYQWYAPVREIRKGEGDRLAQASAYRGLEQFLDGRRLPLERLEVPFTTSHWEAAMLAPRYPLARGWEKQLDTRYDSLFYHRERPLAPAVYHAWLRGLAVRYVAVPAVAVDPASRQEVDLLHHGVPFLRPVWGDGFWRVWEVVDPQPLADRPARVTAVGSQSFGLRFDAVGRSLVRIRFTPYWRATRGCVERGPGGFTTVTAEAPGTVGVEIGFTVSRVVDHGRRCG